MSCPAKTLGFFKRAIHTTPVFRIPRQASSPDDYYSLLLAQPLTSAAPTTFSPPSSPHPSSTTPKISRKPQSSSKPDISVIFGTPLAGPSAARRRAGYGESLQERGIERPREPDNCCMSGCVNCVWDTYREEMEAWAERRKIGLNADRTAVANKERIANQITARGDRFIGAKSGGLGIRHMDEEPRKINLQDEDHLFDSVPVGIREFMATEKRLKEKRESHGEQG
ncbi:MAG: hypothetical protein Q9190_003766 [Brigantiaea leucoxantha]